MQTTETKIMIAAQDVKPGDTYFALFKQPYTVSEVITKGEKTLIVFGDNLSSSHYKSEIVTVARMVPQVAEKVCPNKLAAQVVNYCALKTLSLGGLVERIKAAGTMTREMADAVIVYCQENSLTLGGLVDTLASYSNEVAETLEHGHVTFKNAYAWLASQEQYTFCIDLLEISAHDADADIKVNALENSFVELIRKADAATDAAI